MVSKVSRNRFGSREKRHFPCNGVGSWSMAPTKVLNIVPMVKPFPLSIANRNNSQKGVRYVNLRFLDL